MSGLTFNELIEQRRSVRRYAPSEISREELATIVGEALNAPSWKNNEETCYHIALSADAKNALWKEALPSFNTASSAHAAMYGDKRGQENMLRLNEERFDGWR